MSENLLGTVNIEDVPAQDARAFEAFGVIGEIEQKEVKNEKIMVTVPLTYRRDPQSEPRTAYARLFIHPRWFTPGFTTNKDAEKGTPEYSEYWAHSINFRGLYRSLFRAAGIESGASDLAQLQGKLVGFSMKPQSDDPSRLQIQRFFPPPQ